MAQINSLFKRAFKYGYVIYGDVTGLALQWLRLFITDRTQKIAFAGT